MPSQIDHPLIFFVVCLLALWLAAYLGEFARRRRRKLSEDDHQDFDVVRTSALTLLALLIGFSFSMAVARYDQRKNLEEAEANAVGTQYLRLDLLPAEEATRARALLKTYLDKRIAFYLARDERDVAAIDGETARLQADLWAMVSRAAQAQPTPITALAIAGMNDVLNAQGYTQAAWWNRIPLTAWAMLVSAAIACNLLIGFGERRRRALLLLVFPLIVSSAFLLIAAIDSPRGGVIRVLPQNLLATAQSMRAQ